MAMTEAAGRWNDFRTIELVALAGALNGRRDQILVEELYDEIQAELDRRGLK